MNILMIIGIILGGGVSVVYKFYRKLRFGISMFD